MILVIYDSLIESNIKCTLTITKFNISKKVKVLIKNTSFSELLRAMIFDPPLNRYCDLKKSIFIIQLLILLKEYTFTPLYDQPR